jgi:hypothetical protein
MGICGRIFRNTLSDASDTRDQCVYDDIVPVLNHMARDLNIDVGFAPRLVDAVSVRDSRTTGLCPSLFPWGRFSNNR